MGRSVLLEVSDRPVTSVIICLLGGVWLRIHSVGADYQHVGASYDLVVRGKQLWRLLTAQVSHVSGLHLLFNCSALWNMGYVETRRGSGSLFYLSYTALFLVLSAVGIMGLYALAINAFRREQDAHTLTVGYSCVVFAWMAYLAASAGALAINVACSAAALLCLGGNTSISASIWLTNWLFSAGASATYSLFGALPIPANLMPLGALVFTSVIVPQASFLGHLAGLVAGYVMAFLPTVPLLVNLAVFLCFLGAVGWSLHRQFGSLQHFERLRSYLPLRSSAAEDVEHG